MCQSTILHTSESEAVVDLLYLLLADSEVAAGHLYGGVVEYLPQLDEGHLRILPRRHDDLPSEALAEAVAAEVPHLETVPRLDLLQDDIQPLGGIDGPLLADEAGLVPVADVQRLVAGDYVRPEGGVDVYGPALACLLLCDGDLITVQEHRPGEALEVGHAKAEEGAAADEEADAVVPVIIQPLHKSCHVIPRYIVRRGYAVLC